MKLARLALLFCLSIAALPAFASYGDDVAVIKYCGHPQGEHQGISQVTNQMQRDLYYPDDVVFHFQPVDSGWSLSGAWVKHVHVTRDGLAKRFTCVRDALAESAAEPRPAYDPTISAQTVTPKPPGDTFGIPYFWLIVVLAVTLVLVLLVPSARERMKPAPRPEPRILHRKPEVVIEAERASSASVRRVE